MNFLRSHILSAVLAASGVLFFAADRTAAAEVGLTVPGSQVGVLFSSEYVGYRFTVSSSVQVTGLGYYDREGDGLSSSHLVQLWNADSQQPVTSKTVPAGTSTLLANNFRFVSLDTPINLLIGTTYVVVGQFVSGDGDFLGTTNTPTMGPSVNFVSGANSNSSSPLIFPGGQSGSVYAGGNILYVVPEPSASMMLALGGCALLTRRRRLSQPG